MRIKCGVPEIIAAIPPLVLIFLLIRYCVDIPFTDEWDMVPLVEKFFQGTWSFHDLWEQHNEHRIFFPNLIVLFLARLTSWNIHYEVAVNVLLSFLSFFLLCWQIKKTESLLACGLEAVKSRWLIPAVSLIVFSARPWENWMIGVAIAVFLSVVCAQAGILILSLPGFRWKRLLGALLLGIVSTYSIASGLVFWPVGFLILCVSSYRDRAQRWTALGTWLAVSCAAITIYFYGYAKPQAHPSLWHTLNHPMDFFLYFFTFLGSLVFQNVLACPAGYLGFAGFCLLTAALWRTGGKTPAPDTGAAGRPQCQALVERRLLREAVVPYLGLALFSLGTAAITAVSRAGFSPLQALAPRYVTYSYSFWVSLLVLGAVGARVFQAGGKGGGGILLWCVSYKHTLYFCTIACITFTFFTTIRRMERHNKMLLGARQELLRPTSRILLACRDVEPRTPELVLDRVEVMKKRGWSLFRQ